jgi:hypothetical protein
MMRTVLERFPLNDSAGLHPTGLSSNGTGVCRLAPSGASLHITGDYLVIGYLENRHRHGSIRT